MARQRADTRMEALMWKGEMLETERWSGPGSPAEANALAEMARRISASLDLDEVLRMAVESAHRLVEADVTSLSLVDEHGALIVAVDLGSRMPVLNKPISAPGTGMGGHVLATGRPQQTR